jgi:hypothetical protein
VSASQTVPRLHIIVSFSLISLIPCPPPSRIPQETNHLPKIVFPHESKYEFNPGESRLDSGGSAPIPWSNDITARTPTHSTTHDRLFGFSAPSPSNRDAGSNVCVILASNVWN